MKALRREYKKREKDIRKRLREFRDIGSKDDRDIFPELCFCLLTPQSRALTCDKAIKDLTRTGVLFNGGQRAIRNRLKGVRFPNNKSGYVIEARRLFKNGKGFNIKSKLNGNMLQTRDWFVKNVKGLGYKEASHFLRNIGHGRDLAILDVHILRNLKRYGAIKQIPTSITKKKYLEIEDKMRQFSKRIGIPLEALDLLFWSHETGFIFK